MKKLILSLTLVLSVFAMSATALAAPAPQCPSRPNATVSSNSTSASGTDIQKILDSLKSQGGNIKVAIPSDLKSLPNLLKSLGISIPDTSTCTQSTGQTKAAAPASGSGNAAAPAPSDNGAKPASSGKIDNSSYEQQVITLVNDQRAANGLAPLTANEKLSDVARAKSQDMHDNNYFSHTSPTYGSPFDMLKTFGFRFKAAGENIAMGQSTPQKVVTAWMNSSGHRANILNSAYTQIGVGYVADGNYWTQEFIG